MGIMLLLGVFAVYWHTPQSVAATSPQGTVPPPIYLPLITTGPMPLAKRIGFGLTSPSLSAYPDVASLGAGWYLDWQVRSAPERPNQMSYVQVVRVHQKLACGLPYHSNRTLCPYATPLDYTYQPDQATIEAAAQANPGSLWLLGNEMDRVDWAYCQEWEGAHCKTLGYSGQDEILPETYAVAYHDLYTLIKAVDPTARIAIGGVIQPTPLRLAYLTAIWDSYQTTYSTTMPVEVWNVHNFIIREKANDWGADIPPGIDAETGAYLNNPATHIDMQHFDEQIRAMRQWMKERGQQQKPLIVSEYGVLYPNSLMGLPNQASYIQTFMLATFDYFYNTKDCTLGLISDSCRLVQQWNWYSLDDLSGGFNPYSRLYDPKTGQITDTGERFRRYIAESR
ncbi:MAG: hypothetical protein KF832_03540 [Caldilineaceae bacterium]|nr:hypothetical protein [Caldilineaceae bacterium]